MRISLIPGRTLGCSCSVKATGIAFPTLNEINNCVVYTKYPQPHDPMPLPSDGPEYHEDLAAWKQRQPPCTSASSKYGLYCNNYYGHTGCHTWGNAMWWD